MTPEQRERLADLRVLWVSHSFGYRGDLMYYGEIFRALRSFLPRLAVAVDAGQNFANPHAVSLRPILPLIRRALRRTTPTGESYETELVLPGPTLPLRLFSEPFDALLVSEFTPPTLIATLIARIRRRPVVLLVESDPAARGGSGHALVRLIKRWAVRRASVIQTNNAVGQRFLIEELKADPAKVRIAPYLTSRPPGPQPQIAAREGPVRLLFANSLTPRKGLRELFAALALLSPAMRAELSLTVVGDGPERAALEPAAEALGMGKRLTFAGQQAYSQIGPFYAAADILLIPSLADYRSLAGFEGLGYGLALLASRYDGATSETVEPGVNGYAIDPHNPADLAEKIVRLVQDRALLQRMRQASLTSYHEHFSLERIAENLAESVLLTAATQGRVR